MKSDKIFMLIEGNYYNCIYGGSLFIFRHENRKDSFHLNVRVKKFVRSSWEFYKQSTLIKSATNQEIKWFQECENRGCYVEYEETIKHEHYECW